jgi:hypothetical protein
VKAGPEGHAAAHAQPFGCDTAWLKKLGEAVIQTGRKGRSMESESRIVIGILSCQKTVDRKRAVEATWLRNLPAGQVVAYFLVGRPGRPDELVGNTIYLDCQDTYLALPEKVVAFLKYVDAHLSYDYVFKCDDDTYVDVDALLKVPRGGGDYTVGRLLEYDEDYRGWMRQKGLEWKPAYDDFLQMTQRFPCGGEGYFLSQRAVKAVVGWCRFHTVDVCPPSEDILIAGILKSSGIEPQVAPALAGQRNDVLKTWSVVRDSGCATIHPVGPLRMYTIHWRNRWWVAFVHVPVQLW